MLVRLVFASGTERTTIDERRLIEHCRHSTTIARTYHAQNEYRLASANTIANDNTQDCVCLSGKNQ